MNPSNGISPVARSDGGVLDVVAVDRVEEQRGPDALVEVVALLAERLQLLAGLELLGEVSAGDRASRAERSRHLGSGLVIVSMRSLAGVSDMVGDSRYGDGREWSTTRVGRTFGVIGASSARAGQGSIQETARIRSRSTPASARAIWASTIPNLTPRLNREPAGLERQVAFAPGQGVQCRGELDLPELADVVGGPASSSRSKTVGVSTCMPKKQR